MNTALKKLILEEAGKLKGVAHGVEHCTGELWTEYAIYINNDGLIYAKGQLLKELSDGEESSDLNDIPLWMLVSLIENGKPITELVNNDGVGRWALGPLLDDLKLLAADSRIQVKNTGFKHR